MNVLLTSTSFQDTPGEHHKVLKKASFNCEILRDPIREDELLPIIANYDGVICGDDYYTRKVLEKGALGKLAIIQKLLKLNSQVSIIRLKDFALARIIKEYLKKNNYK